MSKPLASYMKWDERSYPSWEGQTSGGWWMEWSKTEDHQDKFPSYSSTPGIQSVEWPSSKFLQAWKACVPAICSTTDFLLVQPYLLTTAFLGGSSTFLVSPISWHLHWNLGLSLKASYPAHPGYTLPDVFSFYLKSRCKSFWPRNSCILHVCKYQHYTDSAKFPSQIRKWFLDHSTHVSEPRKTYPYLTKFHQPLFNEKILQMCIHVYTLVTYE